MPRSPPRGSRLPRTASPSAARTRLPSRAIGQQGYCSGTAGFLEASVLEILFFVFVVEEPLLRLVFLPHDRLLEDLLDLCRRHPVENRPNLLSRAAGDEIVRLHVPHDRRALICPAQE